MIFFVLFAILRRQALLFRFKMEQEFPVIPRLNLAIALDQEALNASSLPVVHPPSDLVPRPPAAPLKSNRVPSLRQSNTTLAPQTTPSMISRNSSIGELPYKKILSGRLGVRTRHEAQSKSSTPRELPGSQTFRSTMEVLNGRCGSFSSRTSKSAPISDMNRVSESAASWYERRSQVLSTFSAPLFGFCSSPADGQSGVARKAMGTPRQRPQSSGQALAHRWAGVPVECARPTTTNNVPTSAPPEDDPFCIQNEKESYRTSQGLKFENGSRLKNQESRPTVSATATQISLVTQVASNFTEKIRLQNESCFLFPSQGITSPSLGQLSNTARNTCPTLEQAMVELTKGQPLKKFSHASQRVAVKIFRLNSNAELLIDDELQERVVAIFDGLSPHVSPKQSLPLQDDFVPKFVQIHAFILGLVNNSVNRYTFNPETAFHILLINEEFIDVIADSTWTKQCWMTGIRLMLAQMKSKFQPLPIRLPG